MGKLFCGLIFVLGVFVLSCNQGGGGSRASKNLEEYSSGIFAAYMEFRPAHDKFMDSLASVTQLILSGKPGPVDTNSLPVLLANARTALETSFDLIKDIKEIDSTIGLKDSLVGFLTAAKFFYDSDYEKLISLTVTPRHSDSLATLDYVKVGIHALVKKRKSWLAAYQAFKGKYGIDTYRPVDNSPVPAPAMVGRKADTENFPMQAVAVVDQGGLKDLRLPYTRVIKTDTSRAYLVMGTYEGERIGFGLWMRPSGSSVIRFTSIGEPSDRFLRALQNIYKLEIDKISHFADAESADCLSMGDYVDSLKKNGQGAYVTIEQNKLFFEPDDTAWEAECYLNINASQHWIELKEKEEDYRAQMVRDLGRRK